MFIDNVFEDAGKRLKQNALYRLSSPYRLNRNSKIQTLKCLDISLFESFKYKMYYSRFTDMLLIDVIGNITFRYFFIVVNQIDQRLL